jgi:hypothetical protein
VRPLLAVNIIHMTINSYLRSTSPITGRMLKMVRPFIFPTREPALILQTKSYSFCRCAIGPASSSSDPQHLADSGSQAAAASIDAPPAVIGFAGSDPATVEIWKIFPKVPLMLSFYPIFLLPVIKVSTCARDLSPTKSASMSTYDAADAQRIDLIT